MKNPPETPAAAEESGGLRDVGDGAPLFGPLPNLQTLAEEQGVKPIFHPRDLGGDFWPEDETDEELTATIRRWRRRGFTVLTADAWIAAVAHHIPLVTNNASDFRGIDGLTVVSEQ